MPSNFAFLHDRFPELEKLGVQAERYLYSDPASCIMKAGLLCEGMIRTMFVLDRIPMPERCDAVERINILQRRDLLPSDVTEAFHLMRRFRNRAAHEDLEISQDKTSTLLQITHSLCGWFFQTYGDETFALTKFVLPKDESDESKQEQNKNSSATGTDLRPKVIVRRAARKPDTVTPAAGETSAQTGQTEDGQDEQLVEKAVERAATAPSVPEEDRRKRAARAASMRPVTEAETRVLIDEQLRKVGWEADSETLRYSRGTRPANARNIAIAEWPTDTEEGGQGHADYALFVGTRLFAIIEAKAQHKDVSSVLDHQCSDYARHIRQEDRHYTLGTWRDMHVPFLFATNGRPYLAQYAEKSGIWFRDARNPANAPKALHGWMSPTGMEEHFALDVAAADKRLAALPSDFLTDKAGLNLRDYQIRAITACEEAVREGGKTILLAMATGTGKTRTVLGLMYRFLKSGRFRRILFLVDRNALGVQALDVFRDVKLEELHPLEEIYCIKGLADRDIDRETRVHVATVQGMVKRILYSGEADTMPAVTDYDLVIVDEAHRGYILDREMSDEEELYRDQRDYQSKYREVIDYFQAVKIGLTATPALQTTEIFGLPVFSYTYTEAVVDGYLVNHGAPHRLTTELSENGIHYEQGDTVPLYDPVTGEITNSAELKDELDFDVDDFNRKVINENFNRTVLTEIAKDIDPEDAQSGKTLIYAVNDHHADMIVRILKEIYAAQLLDTEAIMKITGSIGNRRNIDEAIRRFKNENMPSIAVTVDLLTTGIDVPRITRLVFLRRVKSRILYEQMLGRATRLCPDIGKTHFEIYDCVGLYDALEPVTSMKPVAAKPTTTFAQLLDGLEAMQDEGQIHKQIGLILERLQRWKKSASKEMQEELTRAAGNILDQFLGEIRDRTPGAAKVLFLDKREAFETLDKMPAHGKRTVVLSDTPDELTGHSRGYGRENVTRPEDYLESFARFLKEQRDRIDALHILCTRPSDLTKQSLRDLYLALEREGFTEQQLNTAYGAKNQVDCAADIIGLIRKYALNATLFDHEERIRRAVRRLKKAHNFSAAEDKWIARIEKHLLNENVLNVETFDETPAFRQKGGFAALDRLFKNRLADIVNELNTYLYDDGGNAA